MASVCALKEYETEDYCKKECEFYSGNAICSEDYDIRFCPYQCENGTGIDEMAGQMKF